MAVIKLTIQPDKASLEATVNEINNKLKEIKGLQIKVDNSGAQAAQILAANLQNVSQAATGVNRVLKETETYVDGTLVKSTQRAQKAIGEYVETVTAATKAGTQQTETYIHNTEEKRKAAEKWARDEIDYEKETARQIEESNKQKRATWEAFVKEQQRYEADQHRKNVEAIQFEAEEQRKLREEQERALTLRREYAQLSTQINEARDKSARGSEFASLAVEAAQAGDAIRNLNADSENYAQEVDALDKKLKDLKARFAEAKTYTKNFGKTQEQAEEEAKRLRKEYADFIRQIDQLKAKYPAGTFEGIKQGALDAQDALSRAGTGFSDLRTDVNKASEDLRLLKAELAEVRQNTDMLDDSVAKAEKTSVDLERQYSNLIRQIQTLKAQYPEGTFDDIEQQATEARDALRQLDSTSQTYVQDVNKLGEEHKKLLRDMANVRSETQKLDRVTESFWMNIQKFARWYIGGNFVVKIVHSLREALSTMKEVDSELANIQKVTDRTTEQMQKTADAAYSVASAYGVSAKDYLESVADFAKAGFGDQAEALAEIATKTQLVGDVSSEVANKFLIASNAAWKMNGSIETLNKTLDAANVIENNYATTIEKLAQGMPIAASVAAQAGMTFDETIAALGTITSVTQETGTKAATALRALILNIVGAVGEYEDGIEVTEESVKSLDGILQTYAKDALAAATAAGTVVNPMEAIAALAKASEEGLVNQAELFEVLSGLGGKLRTNQLTALVQNYGTYLEMLDKTKESAGSAEKEITVMLDTWEAKTNILKNTWTEFVASFIQTDAIKAGLDTVIGLINMLNTDLGKTAIIAAAIPTAVMAIVSAMTPLFNAIIAHPFVAAISLVVTALYAVEVAARKAARAVEDMREAAKDANTEYQSILSAIKELESRSENLTRLEEKRLEILKREAIEAEKEAKQKALSAYYASYSGGMTGSGLNQQWVSYNAQEKARNLIQEYLELQSKLNKAETTAELNELESQMRETMNAITAMADDLLAFQDILGDELPEAGKNAIEILTTFVSGLNRASEKLSEGTGKLTPKLKEGEAAAGDLHQQLQNLSDSADKMDTAIGGVTDAMSSFGANSVQVYDAMKALEAAIPGSTDELYDFNTATLKVDASLFESKESVLDFIDAAKQLEFSQQIANLEKLSDTYYELAAAALTANTSMGADDWLLSQMNPQISINNIKARKREWDEALASVRQRADYQPKDTTTTKESGSAADAELERLKNAVSLRKAELAFLKAKGATEEEILAKNKEIQAALHDQAEYMRSIGADEADILALSTEWWDIQNDILEATKKQKELQDKMFDQIKSIVDTYYDKIVSDKEKELSLEEKILAVQQAEAALANAQRERNVRVFNAATGQWEWQANAKNVKSAQDALKKAQDELNKYQKEQAWKEFKSAWEYVSEQIKAGAMTFKEAYEYMYDAMKQIQDTYGVDLGFVLEDSIGGFKNLNYGIDGLTQEVADSLGNSVGVLNERLKDYETAVDALRQAMDDAAEKVKSGEYTIEDAYSYLRDRAKEISDRYGIDMTGALDEAIAGMDKTNTSIDDLWKSVVLNLMKANSARWFDASAEDKKLLHAQNEYLGQLIGATYDPSGYWSLNGEHLYDPQKTQTKSSSGESIFKKFAAAAAKNPDAVNWEAMREAHNEYGAGIYDDYINSRKTYDSGGVLKGIGGIKKTRRDEFVLPPDLTKKLLDPVNNDLSRRGLDTVRNLFGIADLLPQPIVRSETNNSGDSYTINGVTIGEQEAKVTTVYELARLARGLS